MESTGPSPGVRHTSHRPRKISARVSLRGAGPARLGRAVAHDGVEDDRDQQRDRRRGPTKPVAPAHGGGDPGERRGGGQGADVGGGEHPGERRRELGRLEPARAQEHHRHEGGGAADADDGAAGDQVGGVGRRGRSTASPAWRAATAPPPCGGAPKRSNHMPTGICTANSAKKKALPAQPSWRALRAEVARQLGRDHAVGDAVELAEAGHRDQQQEERQFGRHEAAQPTTGLRRCPSAWTEALPCSTISSRMDRNTRPNAASWAAARPA